MKWATLIFAGFAATASAKQDTDQPHRDWGKTAALGMSVTDATACIVRAKSRGGASTQIIPSENGVDIDYRAPGGLFGGSVGKPWITYQLRENGAGASLTILYRHPYRQGGISKDFANLAKRCLKVIGTTSR